MIYKSFLTCNLFGVGCIWCALWGFFWPCCISLTRCCWEPLTSNPSETPKPPTPLWWTSLPRSGTFPSLVDMTVCTKCLHPPICNAIWVRVLSKPIQKCYLVCVCFEIVWTEFWEMLWMIWPVVEVNLNIPRIFPPLCLRNDQWNNWMCNTCSVAFTI